MIRTTHFHYPSARDGCSIHALEWAPEGPPRGIVHLVHGISEHIGRYDETARFLAEHGFLVCGEDHLGHGRTDPMAFSPRRTAGPWRPGTSVPCESWRGRAIRISLIFSWGTLWAPFSPGPI